MEASDLPPDAWTPALRPGQLLAAAAKELRRPVRTAAQEAARLRRARVLDGAQDRASPNAMGLASLGL